MVESDIEKTVKYIWKPRHFNYKSDLKRKKISSFVIDFSDYHPLKPIIVTETTAVKVSSKKGKASNANSDKRPESKSVEQSSNDFIDPLTALTMTDPLSAPTPSTLTSKNNPSLIENRDKAADSDNLVENEAGFIPWNARDFVKATVAGQEVRELPKRYQPSMSVSEKLKDRLDELDDFEEGGFIEMQNLTQQEFIQRIDILKRTLTEAWNANQKVKALKIAIQCSKLLGSVDVLPFYSSKFVLVTELLDTFGSLVFQRILSMCPGMKAESVDSQKVAENAREICLNWLFKIASIRELLPRLYVEAATLHCNDFLKPGESKAVLVRLTNMARGVGDPLVAIYMRTYLCRVGRQHLPSFKGHLKSNLYDFIATYKQIHTAPVQNILAEQKLDMPTYLRHYTPALEWILSCLAHKASDATLSEVAEKCDKSLSSLLLLNCCISSFNAEFIASRALSFASAINQSQDKLFSKFVVYRSLGVKVTEALPPQEDRLTLLNEVWKVLTKLKNSEHYISCVEVWVDYVARNFTKKEINTVLNDVIKHVIPDRAFEKHYDELHAIIVKILNHTTNFTELFSMEKFLPYLDLFQKEEKKVEVCKSIADAFCKKNSKSLTSDAITISGLMYICKAMHDSVSALSLYDDVRAIGQLISSVLLKVTFGKDFEQQLSFYVECRASFHRLDTVVACLVHAVNTLSSKVTTIVKGNHTRKTAAFVRACTAYAFITIPSLSNIQTRLALYLESGQVALISQCVTQADAMYKTAIGMLHELATVRESKKSSSQQVFTNFVINLLSSLLTVPDNTEQGVLILLRGLLNIISQSSDVISPDAKCNVYIKVLSLLTAYSQDQYLYRIDKVDSNETMYSSDIKFLGEVAGIGSTVLDEILSYIGADDEGIDQKEQSACAFHLFETIVAHGDLSDANMQHLAITIWNVATRHGLGQTKSMVQMLDYLKKSGGSLEKLTGALKLQTRT